MNSKAVFENIEQQLNSLTSREQYKSCEQLTGLFYAVALTPVRITEMEVLPLLFVANKPDMNALQTEHVVMAISEICQTFKQQLRSGALHFPYDLTQALCIDKHDVYEWTLGFFQGLQLRTAFWSYENDGISDNIPVLNSFKILSGFFAHSTSEMAILSEFFLQIPQAIEAIEKFADMVRLEQTLAQQKLNPPAYHPERTGRNEPCPCGSGKKYKKCCA